MTAVGEHTNSERSEYLLKSMEQFKQLQIETLVNDDY